MTGRRPRPAAAAALLLALAACSGGSAPPPPCAGCNVVLISMDTVRSDRLGAYGHTVDTSPNLDRLAAESVLFESAISQSAWTLPAHASMMTGLHPGALGVERYPARRRLPETPPTLAEAFAGAGYATGAFTGGGFVSADAGFGRGFDVYSSKGRRFEHNLDDARGWLESRAGEPFFLFLHGYDAHRPYFSRPLDKRAVGFGGRLEAGGAAGYCGPERARPDDLERLLRYYDAAIHHADRALGRLLATLGELGLRHRTVILVTSDHGEEFFEHGNCDHVDSLYREVVEVPFVLHVPGLSPPGRRVTEVVPASISVAPTLLDLVGVEAGIPGPSLLPLLRGETGVVGQAFSATDSPPGRNGSRGPTIAVTTASRKLILYTEARIAEAFDRETDRHETRVLPESDPVYRGGNALRRWHEEQLRRAAGERSPAQALPEALLEELRALGYLD